MLDGGHSDFGDLRLECRRGLGEGEISGRRTRVTTKSMPRKKTWRISMARKNYYRLKNSVSFKKTTPIVKIKASNCGLFEDLQKTEKRLQYIQARNERQLLSDDESTYSHPEKSKIKIAELKQEKQQMKEEIALLKLKIDLLLGMLAEATAVTTLQHDELKQLRAQIANS